MGLLHKIHSFLQNFPKICLVITLGTSGKKPLFGFLPKLIQAFLWKNLQEFVPSGLPWIIFKVPLGQLPWFVSKIHLEDPPEIYLKIPLENLPWASSEITQQILTENNWQISAEMPSAIFSENSISIGFSQKCVQGFFFRNF